MVEKIKQSRCAFIVIKYQVGGEDYLLMRQSTSWKDLNFIGGHVEDKDARNFERAAKRELREEVPSFRGMSFDLRPLTDEIVHGPVDSRSAGCKVEYVLQFFLMRFLSDPSTALGRIGRRSKNVFVKQQDVLAPHGHRVSELVAVLDKTLSGGLGAVPPSWSEDLGTAFRQLGIALGDQMELPLSWSSPPTQRPSQKSPDGCSTPR